MSGFRDKFLDRAKEKERADAYAKRKAGKAEAKSKGGGEAATDIGELLSHKEMMEELAAYDEKKATEIKSYLSGVEVDFEGLTEEELEVQIEELKENKPHLYESILESFRQEEAMRPKGWRAVIGSTVVRYTALVLFAAPFTIDLVTLNFTRSSDVNFVILGVGLFGFSPLRRLSVHYRIVGVIALMWLNLNPIYAAVSEPGLWKYGSQVVLLFGVFYSVELVAGTFSSGLYGGTKKAGNPYLHGTLSVAILVSISFLIYFVYSGEPMTVRGALTAAHGLVHEVKQMAYGLKARF